MDHSQEYNTQGHMNLPIDTMEVTIIRGHIHIEAAAAPQSHSVNTTLQQSKFNA